jgi:hypothetical protein
MLPDTFWSKVNKNGKNGCWLWTGAVSANKHGSYWIHDMGYGAHRAMMEDVVGERLRKDQHVCHTCDIPTCVNPEHLYIGTAKDNLLDRLERQGHKGIKYRTHRNCNDIDSNLDEAMKMFEDGHTPEYISIKLGVCKSIF